MKKTLLLSILVALFSTRAHATIDGNFPQHFNYPVGSLNGNTSWVRAGPGGNPQPMIVSGNLNICGRAAASGASVSFGGLGTSARGNLNSTYSTGNLYYSFILKITDITSLSASGVFFAGFNNTSGSTSANPTVVGTRLYAKKSGSGYLLGLLKANGGPVVYDTTVHYVNETLFIVVAGTVGTGNAARLWINPSQFGGSAPGATLSDNSGTDMALPISSFVLCEQNANEPNTMILDELYVGTAWADVTPAGSPALAFTSTKNDVTGCNGNANGSITVTPTDGFGPGPLQFSKDNGINWVSDANSSHTFSGLAANSYNIQVKDDNGGCTVSSTVTLTQPAAVTINSITLTNVSCNGGSNGSISVAASGGTGALQFSGNGGSSWSAGTSPYTFSGLPAGSNYNIRVKDANGCTVVYSGNPVAITQPPVLTVSAVAVTNVTCHGAGNGSIKVTVSGGAGEP